MGAASLSAFRAHLGLASGYHWFCKISALISAASIRSFPGKYLSSIPRYLFLVFLIAQGFLFGSKGKVIFPLIAAGIAAYAYSGKIIKTVQVDQYANLQDQAPKREQRYTVTPDPITADSDDDFGFSETVSFFQDAKDRDLSTGEDKTSTND